MMVLYNWFDLVNYYTQLKYAIPLQMLISFTPYTVFAYATIAYNVSVLPGFYVAINNVSKLSSGTAVWKGENRSSERFETCFFKITIIFKYCMSLSKFASNAEKTGLEIPTYCQYWRI